MARILERILAGVAIVLTAALAADASRQVLVGRAPNLLDWAFGIRVQILAIALASAFFAITIRRTGARD